MPSTTDTARSAKGARTRRAVLEAAADIVACEGLAAASQEQVAARAGITQSALRHHFPTKDDLIRSLFDDVHDRHRGNVEETLLEPGLDDRERLTRIAGAHLDFVATSSDALVFESFARASRDPEARRLRNEWYQWLAGHYADLIRRIHPDLSDDECTVKAMKIVTVLLGAWLTAGASRPELGGGSEDNVRAHLLDAIIDIVDAPVSAH